MVQFDNVHFRGVEFKGLTGDDHLTGGYLADLLDGGSGTDTLSGGAGLDTLLGGIGHDSLSGNDGQDSIIGGNGNDRLFGGSHNDTLRGDNGNDTLTGGAGADTLLGGSGIDTFVFLSASDSTVAHTGRDRITSFRLSDDIIDLSALDALPLTVGDDALVFIGTAAFTAAGQVRYEHIGQTTVITVNLNADTSPEMRIDIAGLHVLTAAQFDL